MCENLCDPHPAPAGQRAGLHVLRTAGLRAPDTDAARAGAGYQQWVEGEGGSLSQCLKDAPAPWLKQLYTH
ncbi:hypothetical protein EYF80_008908 [Liparis tanakae]|uniref:Uncharacterized protein n=1 Tax=Liparis tanakae TaxID=230148 RepID=A0A4Z2IUK8_9TELE|nr:hypothetical protein EYF80_008908 [Liparis tanakae]